MTESQIRDYTLKISCANKSGLVSIMFEIFNQYMTEAIDELNGGDYSKMRRSIGKARKVLSDLINSLDLQYEISYRLLSIYRFVEREIIDGEIKRDEKYLIHANSLMQKLAIGFLEVAGQDMSEPIMQNTHTVYAGITYGPNSINENSVSGGSRGFFA